MLDLVLAGLQPDAVVQAQSSLLPLAAVVVLRLAVAALGVLVASVLGVAVAWAASKAARVLTQAQTRWSLRSQRRSR